MTDHHRTVTDMWRTKMDVGRAIAFGLAAGAALALAACEEKKAAPPPPRPWW
jgi:hypothetical protein